MGWIGQKKCVFSKKEEEFKRKEGGNKCLNKTGRSLG